MTLAVAIIGRPIPAMQPVARRDDAMEHIVHHRPVMVQEVLELLAVTRGGTYIDGTVGEGGHAEAILGQATEEGRLLGLDLDDGALETAEARLESWQDSVLLVKHSYSHMDEVASQTGLGQVDGVLLDLGLSSFQLEGSGRGFSFLQDEPLDMRFDASEGETAQDIANAYPQERLTSIIAGYGEEPRARAIARAIVQGRPFSSSHQLADVIAGVVGRTRRVHPATRTFQALRMAVNSELDRLRAGIDSAIGLLKPGGRLAIISYHSLEDRIVKQAFVHEAKNCVCPPRAPACTCGHVASLRLLTRRPINPSMKEVQANPRSRSARLRAAEKLRGQNSDPTCEEVVRRDRG